MIRACGKPGGKPGTRGGILPVQREGFDRREPVSISGGG